MQHKPFTSGCWIDDVLKLENYTVISPVVSRQRLKIKFFFNGSVADHGSGKQIVFRLIIFNKNSSVSHNPITYRSCHKLLQISNYLPGQFLQ